MPLHHLGRRRAATPAGCACARLGACMQATGEPFAVTMVQTFVLDLRGAKISAFNEICGDTAKWNAAVAATNPSLQQQQ